MKKVYSNAFNQKAWLKSKIKKQEMNSKKAFSVFGKTIENVRTHRDIKHVATKRKKKLFGVRIKLS